MISGGDYAAFVESPIVLAFLVLTVALLAYVAVIGWRRRRRGAVREA